MTDQPFDLNDLLSQAMQMQEQLAAAQEEVALAVVEGQAGGGAVRIEVTGAMEFRAVRIRPEAIDPDDVELLQDLVLAALHDAVRRIAELQQRSAGPLGDVLGGANPLESMLGLGADDVLDVEELDEAEVEEPDADDRPGSGT
jgi:DNA-binding YbaB/EbfC family protein